MKCKWEEIKEWKEWKQIKENLKLKYIIKIKSEILIIKCYPIHQLNQSISIREEEE